MENLPTNQKQTMTSLQIAEIAGKQHRHVMDAIRKMEIAWEKVCGSKFRLTSQEVAMPNGGYREEPCYQLTKTECLYIATKFNDEARAKLVLRWEQLETERARSNVDMVSFISEIRAVANTLCSEMEEGKHQIARNIPVTENALILYSYLCRNLSGTSDEFPFITNTDMEMNATGMSSEQIDEAWAVLESAGYIVAKETEHGKVFICNKIQC